MGENGDSDRLVLPCSCGFRMSVTRAQLGKKGRCRGCRQSIRVSKENTRPIATPVGEGAKESDDVSAKEVDEATAEGTGDVSAGEPGEVSAKHALALIKEKKYEEAKAAIQALLERDDRDGDVWYGLAYCLWKLREFAEVWLRKTRPCCRARTYDDGWPGFEPATFGLCPQRSLPDSPL